MHASWRAGRQVGGYAVGLKLERLPVGKEESKEQDTGKVRAFESQQQRNLRRATTQEADCASHQKREELSRRAGVAAIASTASNAVLIVVQVWVEVRAKASVRREGAGS